ncbi:MAG: FecR family protein [Treponema sp.]|nr:FecR family protein [Treponema sp.]MCL2250743.1 FecR family protein [Treponema sp.]
MKKICIFILTLVTVAGLSAQSGVIRELTGEVEIKHSSAAAFVKASAGDEVLMNTIISTGFRSTAVVAIGSSVITIRPLTRLTLAEIQRMENSENVNINLQTGRVRVEVKPPAGSKADFTVHSNGATASVRGTIFETDGFNYKTEEGVIDIRRNANEPVTLLSAGLTTYISTDGTPSDPFTVAVQQITITPIEGVQEIQIPTAPGASEGTIEVIPIYR